MNQMALRFSERVPKVAYATDNFQEHGTWRMQRSKALSMPYVQANPERLVWWLVFDIDAPGGAHAWETENLPPPNFAAINPKNGHAHLFYGLLEPVTRTDTARQAPLKYLAAIQHAYTKALKADRGYAGLLAKNPLHEKWHTAWFSPKLYEMGELSEWVTLPKFVPRREVLGLGRNCTLFDELRKDAYKFVLEYKSAGATFPEWLGFLAGQVQAKNCFPVSSGGALPEREAAAIAKSVAKWTWAKFSQSGLSEWQRDKQQRAAKSKRAKTQSAVMDAIKTLQSQGKAVSMNKVAKLIGTSQQNISKNYGDLFEGLQLSHIR